MINWLKSLFSGKKQYISGSDSGSADGSTFVEGYIDKKGIYHITKMEYKENTK